MKVSTTCIYCGVGCNITLDVKMNKLRRKAKGQAEPADELLKAEELVEEASSTE